MGLRPEGAAGYMAATVVDLRASVNWAPESAVQLSWLGLTIAQFTVVVIGVLVAIRQFGAGATGKGRSRGAELHEASTAVATRAGMANLFIDVSLRGRGEYRLAGSFCPFAGQFAVIRKRKQGFDVLPSPLWPMIRETPRR